MSLPGFENLWTRFLDDQPIDDQQAVQHMLSADKSLRDIAVRDAELDGLLRALGRVGRSEDTFVDSVLDSLDSDDGALHDETTMNRLAEQADGGSDWSDSFEPLVAPPVQHHPTPPPRRLQTADRHNSSPEIAISKSGDERDGLQRRLGPYRWPAILCGAAVICTIAAGLAVVFALRGHEPVATDDLPNRDRVEPRDPVLPEPPPLSPESAADQPSSGEAEPAQSDLAPPAAPPVSPKQDDSLRRSPTVADQGGPQARPEVAPSDSRPPVYGRIVDDTRAIWESPVSAGWAGEAVRLRSGTVTVQMADGTALTIQGPSEFQLDAANSVSLRHGRVVAAVPTEAIGFQITTPTSRVIDLGTEFSVDVDNGGATGVHVLSGQVDVFSSRHGEQHPGWRLGRDQYKWIPADASPAFDWRLRLTVHQKPLQGMLYVNGQQHSFENAQQFAELYTKVFHQLHLLRPLVSHQRRDEEPFRALLEINDDRFTISDSTDYARMYRRVNSQLKQLLWNALQDGVGSTSGVFGGSIIINGEEFRFNSLDDLLQLQDKIEEGF